MAKVTAKTEETNKEYIKIMDKLGILDDAFITIGVHQSEIGSAEAGETDKESGDDATLAEIAFFNEFGTRLIEERSFIRSTMDENKVQFNALNDELLNQLVLGTTNVPVVLDVLGFRIRESIKNKMLKGPFPPNKPSTLKNKVGNQPLIDSHRLFNSIEYKASE